MDNGGVILPSDRAGGNGRRIGWSDGERENKGTDERQQLETGALGHD